MREISLSVQLAVLNQPFQFTDSPKIALCSDSGGSVFELNFTRVMGVRGCDSRCLFSGSKGEVCTLEPLLLNHLPSHPLKNYTLVAMATLSKVLLHNKLENVVSIKCV